MFFFLFSITTNCVYNNNNNVIVITMMPKIRTIIVLFYPLPIRSYDGRSVNECLYYNNIYTYFFKYNLIYNQ